MDAAYNVCDKVELITPARFLFNAGKTPKEWNEKVLNDPHLKVLHYEKNSYTIFPNTDIKGGVAITYHDLSRKFGAIEHFIPNDLIRNALQKVRTAFPFSPLSNSVNSTEYFKISDTLYKAHPEILKKSIIIKGKEVPLVSKGHEYDLTSNILDKNPALFFETKPNDGDDYVRIYGRQGGKRVFRFFERSFLQPVDGLNGYKVILPESNSDGTFGETLVSPFVAEPDVVTTQTFITIGFYYVDKFDLLNAIVNDQLDELQKICNQKKDKGFVEGTIIWFQYFEQRKAFFAALFSAESTVTFRHRLLDFIIEQLNARLEAAESGRNTEVLHKFMGTAVLGVVESYVLGQFQAGVNEIAEQVGELLEQIITQAAE